MCNLEPEKCLTQYVYSCSSLNGIDHFQLLYCTDHNLMRFWCSIKSGYLCRKRNPKEQVLIKNVYGLLGPGLNISDLEQAWSLQLKLFIFSLDKSGWGEGWQCSNA